MTRHLPLAPSTVVVAPAVPATALGIAQTTVTEAVGMKGTLAAS